MSLVLPSAKLIGPPAEDQIRLAGEEIMGYIEIIAGRTALVDDLTAFGIFPAVCSAPQQTSPSPNRFHRTDTSRSYIRSGPCIVSEVTIHPCHARLSFSDPGIATFSTTLNQRVSDVLDWDIWLDTRATETDHGCTSVTR